MNGINRPALRYHGGKYRLAPWILSFFPRHHAYVEPFGGGASVLLQKERCPTEVYNDLDSNIVNVFWVLQDPMTAAALKRLVELTPFAREEFDRAYQPGTSTLEHAHKTIVKSFMGHGSDSATRFSRTGFRAKKHVARAAPAQEWSSWPDSIPMFCERLRGVVIENRDAFEVMERYDDPATLFYVDPPYVLSTRNERVHRRSHGYKFELADEQHEALIDRLKSMQGMIVLSAYAHPIYTKGLKGWQYHETEHHADGGLKATECLWLNKAAVAALDRERSQSRMFA